MDGKEKKAKTAFNPFINLPYNQPKYYPVGKIAKKLSAGVRFFVNSALKIQ